MVGLTSPSGSSLDPFQRRPFHLPFKSNSDIQKRMRSSHYPKTFPGPEEMPPRNRLSPRQETLGPHGLSARPQRSPQPSLAAPRMAEKPIYTRTGRISKAKKGLKVHHCSKCGRSYTRAEHLRRHQKNHEEEPLRCKFPECGKKFHREDLLQRHEERHHELNRGNSRAPSIASQQSAPELDPALRAPIGSVAPERVPSNIPEIVSSSLYTSALAGAQPDTAANSRYKDFLFRPPEGPRKLRSSLSSSSISRKTRASSSSHAYIRSVVPVSSEGYAPFHDSWSPTQPHSSSSGYASPGYDYSNMHHANHSYDPSSMRTRTSSNASLVGPWQSYQHPISPVSTASSLLFSWTDAEKSPGVHALSLPVSGVTTSTFGIAGTTIPASEDHLHTLNMFQISVKPHSVRDDEERKVLFPDEHYDLVSEVYQSGHYLENYWEHFHPAFPIIHRPTFDHDSQSQTPLLRAAMIAIGAQYSEQPNSKADSRSLHERCVKLLAQRDLDVSPPQRICDLQAIFLIEVLSQYRGRRATPQLTTRFKDLYMNLANDTEIMPSVTIDELSTIAPIADAHAQMTQWKEWIRVSSKQRLVAACFILEAQQLTLLSRKLSNTRMSGYELPVPAPVSVWDAENASRWATLMQQHPSTSRYVYEISTQYAPTGALDTLDAFQSALLIFTHYDAINTSNSYFSPSEPPDFATILNSSTQTQLLLLTAQLSQAVPILELLAVSGESWILNEKIPSKDIFEAHKQVLSGWVSKLWLPDSSSDILKPVRLAINLSVQILRLALDPRPDFKLTLGTEMGLYFAVLVLWAVTGAATARWHRSNSQAPPAPTSTSAPPLGLERPAAKSIEEIERESFDFLHIAATSIDKASSRSLLNETALKQWQNGVSALMSLLAARLNGNLNTGGGFALGELLDGVLGVLKKLTIKPREDFHEMF